MQEILGHVRSTWRYRWIMLLIACPISVGGWAWVESLPDQYEASARVYIDTNSILLPLMAGLTVGTDVSRQIEIMTKTLLSRPNLEKLAQMTDLDIRAKTPDQLSGILDGLARNIKMEQVAGVANLYTIKYENRDPKLAKRVVQSLLTIFVESTLGSSRKDSDNAQNFLDQQIKDYENRLAEAEDRLAQFKRKNIGLMPGQGGGYYQNLQNAIGDLEQSKLELQEGEDRYQALKRQAQEQEDEPAAAVDVLAPGTSFTPELDGRINNLKSRLDELLLKYTDQHPEVVTLKETIADLEAQRQAVVAAQKKSKSGNEVLPNNPYSTQMQLAVGEAEANVAALKARVAARQKQVEDLKKMVNILPTVEEQLKQLNRDYDVTKSSYESLLQRRESANMSEQLDQNADTVKFRVVDPPFVPPQATDPNRPLLSSEVLLGSIVAGVALAFLLAQLNPTFDSRRELIAFTNLPVLGGVSMLWTDSQLRKRRRNLWGFGAAVMVLLGFYGGIMTLQIFKISPLAHLNSLF